MRAGKDSSNISFNLGNMIMILPAGAEATKEEI